MNEEDRQLLEFDEAAIEGYSRREAEANLAGEHGEAFRTHLIAARWVEQWADSLEERRSAPDISADEAKRREGVIWGLREVAAHLRLGDFLPGAGPYEQAKP